MRIGFFQAWGLVNKLQKIMEDGKVTIIEAAEFVVNCFHSTGRTINDFGILALVRKSRVSGQITSDDILSVAKMICDHYKIKFRI